MPIESCGNLCSTASSRNRRKYGRVCSGSSDQGGIVISPSSRKLAKPFTAAMSAGTLWLAACVVPPAVMLAVWRGAPPLTVAEVLYAVDGQGGPHVTSQR